jgi:hypothetical protein
LKELKRVGDEVPVTPDGIKLYLEYARKERDRLNRLINLAEEKLKGFGDGKA